MNIKKSLFLCVGLLLALTGLQGAQSLWQISRLAAAADSIVATSLVATESQALWSRFVATEDGFKRAIGLTDALAAGEQRATVTAGIQALRQAAADVQAHATPALADAARAVAARVAKWSELAVPHLSAEGVTALPAYHLLDEARAELEAGIGALVRDSQAESAAVAAASHGQARAAVVWTGGELAAAVALGLAIGWFTLRTLNRQLGADPSEVAAVANAVADGDLTAAVRRTDAPAGSVMAATARMQQSLIETVARVRAISEALAHGVDQIAAGSSDLSGRTEQQLHALGQTAATTQQLQSTVQQNAHSARQADELAQGASGVAARGGEVVSQVVDTMRGINDSSKKIADIIGVIDAIAFQTNILALNAAVEAARAGEAGRGFAVVAAEVRSLATRCADAARQIKALIEASVGQVRQGTQLVDQAGATIAEIIGSIGHVTDLMGRISSASVEQSAGVAEVGRAVSHMDAVTQQNAALAEQSAGAAESVRAQALELVQAVAVFRLPAAA